MSKKSFLIFYFFTITFFLFYLGKSLDWEAERVIDQLYPRSYTGVIKGLDTVKYQSGKQRAIIFIHGFLDSPMIFNNYFKDISLRQHYDIYLPRLRFHAQNLQTANHFNNDLIQDKLRHDIHEFSKNHDQVTIVAQSYAGILVLKLLNAKQLPSNSKVILLAPAFYIKENNFWGNFKLYIFSLWRHYCNYPQLGCKFPGINSGDSYARHYIEHAKTLHYLVLPALKQLFLADRENRLLLSKTSHNFSLIIAKDDNRVNYSKIASSCSLNPYCHLSTFPSGRHLLQRSKFSNKLLTEIQELS